MQLRDGEILESMRHGGIALDQPLNNGALILDKVDLSPFVMRNQTIGPNLRLIGRPDASIWAAAINTHSFNCPLREDLKMRENFLQDYIQEKT